MIAHRTEAVLLAAALLAALLPTACMGGRRQPYVERLKFLRHAGGITLAVPDSFFVEERPYGFSISLAGPKDLRAPEQLEVLIRPERDKAVGCGLPGALCARVDSVDGPAGRYYAARVRLRYGETAVLLYQPDRNPRLDMPTFDLLRRTRAGLFLNRASDAYDTFERLGRVFGPGATESEPFLGSDILGIDGVGIDVVGMDVVGIEDAWDMPGMPVRREGATPGAVRDDHRVRGMVRPVHCRDST